MNKKTGRIITTKYGATCWGCKKHIPAGSKVLWYGQGEIYGLTCHDTREDNHKRHEIPLTVLKRIEAIFDMPTLDDDEPIDLYIETGLRFHLDDM